MRVELRNEMLRILEELSKGGGFTLYFADRPLTYEAVRLLAEHGAVEELSSSYYGITISGYDYYEELKSPRVRWAKKNWFPVAVLIVSSVVTVVANLIAALLD